MMRDTCSSAEAAYSSSRVSGYMSAALPKPSRASCAIFCTLSASAASSSCHRTPCQLPAGHSAAPWLFMPSHESSRASPGVQLPS